MNETLIPVILSGLALALVTGPLGCFVVWRRMAYFGDGLAHSALLGIALGMAAGLGHQTGILLSGILFALLLVWLQARNVLATDTLLGILAHAMLALGIVAMGVMGAEEIEIHDFLLGSLDAISYSTSLSMLAGAVISVLFIIRIWPGLIMMTISEDIAQAEGVRVKHYNFFLMLLMAITVALSIQLVGILLITSLLIIPASCARLFSRTPEHMAISTVIIGSSGIIGGFYLAGLSGLTAGPVIVSCLVLLFVFTLMARLALR